ncbi:nitrate- and nitrite sensing domain-containing protein [Melissospora conviva]|uniref:sensor histidine kinase n=1 Tax=Melissospora conviva TaxID=3388432 RepID=UPI003C281A11
MSSRPKAAGSFLSRLRRPVGRLSDMPIWSKLGLIMIVPTVATVVVGTSGLIDHLDTLSDAGRAHDLAILTQHSGELVAALQDERANAVLLLGAGGGEPVERYTEIYTNVTKTTDAAAEPYSRQRTTIQDVPANFTDLLGQIDQNLGGLPGIRSQVLNGKLKLTEAAQTYEGLIADLLDVRDSATQLAGDTNLSERMRAASATARAKEFLSVRRVVVHRALIQGSLTPLLRTEYIATQTGQQQALQTFLSVSNQAEKESYEQTVAGPDLRESDLYSDWIGSTVDESLAGAPFTADRWDAAMAGNSRLIRAVEADLDGKLVAQADEIRSGVQRQVFLETGLLLSTLLLAILLAWVVARSMARSLRELRDGAFSVAQFGLPQAVARLRDPKVTGQLSPTQLASQIAEPLPVRGNDEFGQVTKAFNAVHLEAVRTAAEQAALRSSVSTMFVNLARRSQILVDRLIGHLDRLERGEEDPDRLAELFQLDHLATRMRRNDENLLVLAGADSTRVQREPAALIDVLRAAQSEVEHYTRIEFGVVDRDIEVSAHAVNDLVHLVAELFDNATSFSPPDSQILVEARRVGDRASLYVEDRGIGISGDQLRELNEKLAMPPAVDVTVSRMMGLVVVARLAARHGVKVELRPGSDRGTVADVTLPTSVLVPRALAGRNGTRLDLPPAPAAPQAGRTPTFGAIAALESGPSTPSPTAQSTGFGGGRETPPAPRNGSVTPPPSRPLPAWSDLTGVAGLESADPFVPRQPEGGFEPLPQRRAGGEQSDTRPGEAAIPQQRSGESDTAGGGMFAPRKSATPESPQTPSGPQHPGGPPKPFGAQSPSGPQDRFGAQSPGTPAGAPPAWPPAAGRRPEQPGPQQRPAASDLTTELPRVPRTESTAGAAAPQRNAGGHVPARPAGARPAPAYADETMELPIFRELESNWFRTRRPADEAGPGTPPGPAARKAVPAPGFAPQQARPAATQDEDPPPVRRPTGGGGWQTAADEGWRAASAAKAGPVETTTAKGLPKRTPMAQLVPGGVEKPAVAVQRRSPEAVRGLLSAYHRGVQRGRTNPMDGTSTNPEATPGGQQSSQSGSGGTAKSGQKEHEG